jgi:hypothetical protein
MKSERSFVSVTDNLRDFLHLNGACKARPMAGRTKTRRKSNTTGGDGNFDSDWSATRSAHWARPRFIEPSLGLNEFGEALVMKDVLPAQTHKQFKKEGRG